MPKKRIFSQLAGAGTKQVTSLELQRVQGSSLVFLHVLIISAKKAARLPLKSCNPNCYFSPSAEGSTKYLSGHAQMVLYMVRSSTFTFFAALADAESSPATKVAFESYKVAIISTSQPILTWRKSASQVKKNGLDPLPAEATGADEKLFHSVSLFPSIASCLLANLKVYCRLDVAAPTTFVRLPQIRAHR